MVRIPDYLDSRTIRRRCGDIPDWKVAAIAQCGGAPEDLETALAWAAGEDDIMGEARRPLAGAAMQIYNILLAEEDRWERPDDRPHESFK